MNAESALAEISLAQYWLASMRPLRTDVTEELRHRFEVALTYNSTAIEGNTLTRSETQIVIEKGITIAGKSLGEHLEIVGHKEALDYVLELAQVETPVGEREIRELHSLVMKGQEGHERGGYRTLDVKAAGSDYSYPSHLQLPVLMAEFAAWLAQPMPEHPVLHASEAHLRFVSIHPFRDGNGRVGRLLLNLLLIRAGYPIAVIPVTKRAEYIEALEMAQSGGGRSSLDALVMEAVKRSLMETLEAALSSASLSVDAELRREVSDWIPRG